MAAMFVIHRILTYIYTYIYIDRWHGCHVHYSLYSNVCVYVYIKVTRLWCSLPIVFLYMNVYICTIYYIFCYIHTYIHIQTTLWESGFTESTSVHICADLHRSSAGLRESADICVDLRRSAGTAEPCPDLRRLLYICTVLHSSGQVCTDLNRSVHSCTGVSRSVQIYTGLRRSEQIWTGLYRSAVLIFICIYTLYVIWKCLQIKDGSGNYVNGVCEFVLASCCLPCYLFWRTFISPCNLTPKTNIAPVSTSLEPVVTPISTY